MKITKSFLPRSLFATAFATVVLAALLLMPLTGALAANKYYKSTTANSWTGSFWGNASGGPYTTAWASGSDVFFDDNSGTTSLITGASTAFNSITANENVTVTPLGTLATGGTVASVTVASGKTLNFQAQSLRILWC